MTIGDGIAIAGSVIGGVVLVSWLIMIWIMRSDHF